MAGQKFQYDESGSTFFYFLLSFIGLALIPLTAYFVPADKEEEEKVNQKKIHCNCTPCLEKEARLKKQLSKWKPMKKKIHRILIFAGWAFLAMLVYKVQQFDYENANFDPYEILGIDTQTSSADIKKAYRKQSLVLHPDKPTGDEALFMKLNKAYEALTDPTSRKNYEMYGNPDGPGTMNFGIALPSWIVQKENSIWVLGLYTLVFMIGLPTVVGMWWYRSSRFSADQVLIETQQLMYYFINKTPSMNYKRALMIISASFEYSKDHNSAIQMRMTDNVEIPALFKLLQNLQVKISERPLSDPYSVKARTLLHAHLSRLGLNPDTLDKDRIQCLQYINTLVNEMVTATAQLMMLAHAGRIQRLPTLDTVEAIMKLSPTMVQALWETQNPVLQLPHFNEQKLRTCTVGGKSIRSIQQLASFNKNDRNKVMKNFTPEEQTDILQVLCALPKITMNVKPEVQDDEDEGVFTAGAIVTVTVNIKRKDCGEAYPGLVLAGAAQYASKVVTEEPKRPQQTEEEKLKMLLTSKKDTKWSKQKKNDKKAPVVVKKLDKTKKKSEEKEIEKEKKTHSGAGVEECETSDYSSQSHSDESDAENADTEQDRKKQAESADDDYDEDQEWERLKKGHVKKEKVLEGKSKFSHPVHCPYFSDDKQEYWWLYVCDRKKNRLVTVPYQITDLVTEQEAHLKMTAPEKPGAYHFQVVLVSDSYVGVEECKDIKLDVKKAKEIPTDHPQWNECSSDEESEEGSESEDGGKDDEESEFTTDSESEAEE